MSEEKESIFLKNFIPQLKDFIKSETVFGEPYEINNTIIIPVNSVKVGFGFGNTGMKKNSSSKGGGGGVLLTPVAFIVIKGDVVTTHSLATGTIENLVEKTPELIEKLLNLIQKKKEDS